MGLIPVITFGVAVVLALSAIFSKKIRASLGGEEEAVRELLGTALLGFQERLGFLSFYATKGGKRAGPDPSFTTAFLKLAPQMMRMLLSLALTALAIWIVFSNQFTPQQKDWGYTTLGTVLGYWLKR